MSDQQVTIDQAELDAIRARAGTADEATTAATSAERTLAFLRAGVDEESPAGKMFMKAYDGDLADLEALKVAATEVGALKATAPPAPPESSVSPEEAAARAAAAGITGAGATAGGAAPPPKPDPDPIEEAINVGFNGALANGQARDRAMIPVVGAILEAASKGDTRVLYDANRDRGQERRQIKTVGTGQ